MDVDDPEDHLHEDQNVCVVCEEGEADRAIADVSFEKLATNLKPFSDNDLLSKELKGRVLKNAKMELETALKLRIYKIREKDVKINSTLPSCTDLRLQKSEIKKVNRQQQQSKISVHQKRNLSSWAVLWRTSS